MNRLDMTFNAPPFSINSAYYNKGGGKVRTKECRAWGDDVLQQLQLYKQQILEFKNIYDAEKHGLSLDLTFNIPKRYYYTVEGRVSSRSADLTNVEKLIQDLLFDSRFNGRAVNGKKIYNLDINDKCVLQLSSKKLPSDRFRIEVSVSLIPLPIFEDIEDEN